jgi:hypothetical protein
MHGLQTIKKQNAAEYAKTNPFKVKVGQVWRGWDPRERHVSDSEARFTIEVLAGAYAYVKTALGAQRRIRLDRFRPANYRLLKDVA